MSLTGAFAAALHVRPGVAGVVGNGTGDDTAAIQAILANVDPAAGVTDVYIHDHDGIYMIDGVNESASGATRNRWRGGGLLPEAGTRL